MRLRFLSLWANLFNGRDLKWAFWLAGSFRCDSRAGSGHFTESKSMIVMQIDANIEMPSNYC
jgi:hypothetical protein